MSKFYPAFNEDALPTTWLDGVVRYYAQIEMPVCMRSLMSSILSLTGSQWRKTIWGLARGSSTLQGSGVGHAVPLRIFFVCVSLGFWGQPQGPNFPSPWATILASRLDCSTAALTTPQKVSSNWELVELKMLDFSDHTRTGISILISAAGFPWGYGLGKHSLFLSSSCSSSPWNTNGPRGQGSPVPPHGP